MTSAGSDRPLVSVVVPTYERLAYLREAVASVVAQTYPHWELVVVDDGSTDGSAEWVRSLNHPRIRVVALAHTGNLGHNRNQGIAVARGELIALLDSDDAFEADKLETQVAALAVRPECGWSYSALTRVDAAGHPLPYGGERRFRAISGWILEALLRFDALVDTPTVMARRELLDRVGPLDEALDESQDYELFFRMAAVSQSVAIARPLTRKRVHASSLGSSNRLRVHEAWVEIYDRFGSASMEERIKRVCEVEARRHRVSAAARSGTAGDPARALAHLLPALRERPLSPRAWKVLAVHVLGRGMVLPALRRLIG
jgi:glycosyltransferase involved in cell wall biosynthesis